jgi:hypothetical protein
MRLTRRYLTNWPRRRRFVLAALLAICVSAFGAASAQAQPPAIITLPTISGNAVEGETLIGTHGTWEDEEGMTFELQWQRSIGAGWQVIAGATNGTYVLTAADVGHRIRLQVTATNAHPHSTTVESAPTAPVAEAPEPPVPPQRALELFVSPRPTAFKRATIRASGVAAPPLRLWVYENVRGRTCPAIPAERNGRTRTVIDGVEVGGAFTEERRPKMKKPGRHAYCAYLGPNEATADMASFTTRKVRKPLLKAPRARGAIETAIERHGFAKRVANNLQGSCSRRNRSEFECRFTSAFPGYFLRGSGSVELKRRLSYRFQAAVGGRSFVLTDENEGGLPG